MSGPSTNNSNVLASATAYGPGTHNVAGNGGGGGDVTGPASSSALNIAVFADGTGKVIQDSLVPVSSVLVTGPWVVE